MLKIFIETAAGLVSIYSTLCFIRIILTWFPPINYGPIGRFFSSLCDPYLNLFSKLPLRIGMIDFTAMVAIGVLYVISAILESILRSGYISLSIVLGNLIYFAFSIGTSILSFITLIFLIRLLVSIFSKSSNQYDSPWQRFDDAIRVIVFKICSFFSGGRNISYKTALLIDTIALFATLFISGVLLKVLLRLVALIPF